MFIVHVLVIKYINKGINCGKLNLGTSYNKCIYYQAFYPNSICRTVQYGELKTGTSFNSKHGHCWMDTTGLPEFGAQEAFRKYRYPN